MLKRKEKVQFESPDRLNRIVEGTRIVGNLISESNIRIDGEVHGNISTTAKVVIGENGILKGDLNCQEADIEGKVEGKLSIEGLLTLREKAKIQGDIQTLKLHIEEGAFLLGACKMNSGPNSASKSSIPTFGKEPDDIIY
jgi:cytoskeletal protein CcmA (bactofilin family)